MKISFRKYLLPDSKSIKREKEQPLESSESAITPMVKDLVDVSFGLKELSKNKASYTPEDFKKLKKEQVMLCTRLALDIGGFFDPTPICDGLSAILSLTQLDFTDAALSVVSMLPYLGDAVAKPLKGGKFAVKMTRAIKKGRKMRKALKQSQTLSKSVRGAKKVSALPRVV